ncbi:MAG: hypothetical protein HEEMFOPI_00333 [Holosporales bacterium]
MPYIFAVAFILSLSYLSACSCCSDGSDFNKNGVIHFHSKDKNIAVENPYFALYKGAKNGAAYCHIQNFSKKDKLVKVYYFGDGIKTLELHTHVVDEKGIAKMREVDSFVLDDATPQQPSVKILEPGHDHIMLLNIDKEMHQKEKISLVLEFENAGKMEVFFTKKEVKKPCCSLK